jgi:hypothetical protein
MSTARKSTIPNQTIELNKGVISSAPRGSIKDKPAVAKVVPRLNASAKTTASGVKNQLSRNN